MKITKTLDGNNLKLAIEGRLETVTAPELETVVRNELGDVENLVFDFTELDYISSAGLRVILTAQKIMAQQGTMKIVGANDIVQEVFELTGFSDILTLE